MENEVSIEIDKLVQLCEQKENYFTALIINNEEKEKLSFYIAVQLFRTKKFRKILQEPYKNVYETRLRFLGKYLKQTINSDFEWKVQVKIDEHKLHLSMLADNENLILFANFLFDSEWCFFRNITEIPFITSDNPVCRVPIIDNETNTM